jgi:hypothetical protein
MKWTQLPAKKWMEQPASQSDFDRRLHFTKRQYKETSALPAPRLIANSELCSTQRSSYTPKELSTNGTSLITFGWDS